MGDQYGFVMMNGGEAEIAEMDEKPGRHHRPHCPI
jgi:hypothetical protein